MVRSHSPALSPACLISFLVLFYNFGNIWIKFDKLIKNKACSNEILVLGFKSREIFLFTPVFL